MAMAYHDTLKSRAQLINTESKNRLPAYLGSTSCLPAPLLNQL